MTGDFSAFDEARVEDTVTLTGAISCAISCAGTITGGAIVDGRNIIRGELSIVRLPDGRTLAEVLAENERLCAFVATVRGALP